MSERKAHQLSFSELFSKDRETRKEEEWSGTFLDYLEMVKKDRTIPRLAHERIYDLLRSAGFMTVEQEGNPKLKRLFKDPKTKIYNFFKDEFFGMENTIEKIFRYFHAASLKGEESRQVLYLVGPVGSGKSSLVEHIKKALERTKPVFVIQSCPMLEEPLHLVPEHLRPEVSEMLGVKIEGDLCPVCRYNLTEQFDNQFEEVPVATRRFSIRLREGIGVVPPVDPNNQDTSVLIGSEDISKLDKYSEGDPRVLDLSGAFNVANRGIVEFIEVFKNETEYLHTMITATQEKMIPAPGRHGMIYVDTVIIAHSNEAEWNKFKADHTNEAILDRIVTVKVPYNLELSEEIKIYNKILKHSKFDAHIAPHTIEVASMFAILTRLEKTNKCDLLTKLKIYNGEEIVEKGRTKRIDVEELREDGKREGMDGISTRFIMKSLDDALSNNMIENCINPISIMESLVKLLKSYDFAEETRREYLEIIQNIVHKEYLTMLEREITKAFVFSYKEQAEALFQNYLDHAEAYVNKSKVKVSTSQQELEPDIKFMASIEEQIGISGASADGFRQEVISFLWSISRRDLKVEYTTYEPLKEAIEKKLMASVKELSRIITKATTRDEEQNTKYDTMVTQLIENGYCEHCVDVVLKYAANNLWKD